MADYPEPARRSQDELGLVDYPEPASTGEVEYFQKKKVDERERILGNVALEQRKSFLASKTAGNIARISSLGLYPLTEETFPTWYGIYGAAATTATFASLFGVYTSPLYFGKYLMPEEQALFANKTSSEKKEALFHDTFAASIAPGIKAFHWAWKTGKGVTAVGTAPELVPKATSNWDKWLRGEYGAKVVPVEDAVAGIRSFKGPGGMPLRLGTKPFLYEKNVENFLKKNNIPELEWKALSKGVAEGNPAALEAVSWGNASPGLRKLTFADDTGRLQWKPEAAEALSERTLRESYWSRQYTRTLEKHVFPKIGLGSKWKEGDAVSKAGVTVRQLWKHQVKRLWPEKSKLGFADVTHHAMSNIVYDMLSHTNELKTIARIGGRKLFPVILSPTRTIFGAGETLYGTYSNVYLKLKDAFGSANRDAFKTSLVWLSKMKKAGFLEEFVTKGTQVTLKKAAKYTAKVEDDFFTLLMKRKEIFKKSVGKEGDAAKAFFEEEMTKATSGLDPAVTELVGHYDDFRLFMYGKMMKHQLPRVFRSASTTLDGKKAFGAMLPSINERITNALATGRNIEYLKRLDEIDGILTDVKGLFATPIEGSIVHPYFRSTGTALEAELERLAGRWTMGVKPEQGQFPQFLEHYNMKLGPKARNTEENLMNRLTGGLQEKYAERGLLHQVSEPVTDLASHMREMISSQSKELFAYDRVGEVVSFAKKNLPPDLLQYTDHVLGRAMNKPSIADYHVANTISRFPKWMGLGEWDATRVVRAGQFHTDLVYMGLLGFKPFSALRNLFQPLLTVPGDLGGAKDIGTYTEGLMLLLRNPQRRQLLYDIGVVTQYAEEAAMPLKLSPIWRGKNLLGVNLPEMSAVRDGSLVMFRGADGYNRLTTGSAALLKWDRAIELVGGKILPENLAQFKQAVGTHNKYPWVQERINDMLLRGQHTSARNIFVKESAADTQFLYTGLDSPTLFSKGGAAGRSAFVFQTWWMNYGALLEKWAMYGTTGAAQADRFLSATIAQASAFGAMSMLWGKERAFRATFFGPFNFEVNEFLIPPTYKPVYHILRAIQSAPNPKEAVSHLKRGTIAATSLTPAGHQLYTMGRRAKEEGFSGFAKSILGGIK